MTVLSPINGGSLARLEAVAAADPGRNGPSNEDSLLVVRSGDTDTVAVADGPGGNSAGGVATSRPSWSRRCQSSRFSSNAIAGANRAGYLMTNE